MPRDYYEILGVRPEASESELKKAFRSLAMQCHPDRNPGDKQAEERFKEINEAYAVLSDPDKRAHYDRFGTAPGTGAGPGEAAALISRKVKTLTQHAGRFPARRLRSPARRRPACW